MKLSTVKKLIKMTDQLYNEKAISFDKTRNQVWEKEILDFLKNIKQNSSVLDLGCGNARLLPRIILSQIAQIEKKEKPTEYSDILKNMRVSYLGNDIGKKFIALNRKRYPGIKFKVEDGLKLKYKNKFDYVISIAVLHHIPSEKLQLKFLKNIHDSLKPNGKLFISVWNRWQKKYQKYFKQKKPFADMDYADIIVPWKDSGQFRYIHAFKPDELRKLAKKAGFTNINLKEALNIYLIGEK